MRRPGPLAAAAALLALAACDPFRTEFRDTERAVRYRARTLTPAPPPTGPIRVMTWNVKFGGARLRFFFECDGRRTLMTEREVRTSLDGIAARIRAWAPDVLLLQEIDTGASKRVAYVDEVQYLLDRSGLNHGAYASQWRADYVPSDGIGPVDSGNAVLSRWPIASAVRHALALQTDVSALERYFYLKRNVLEVRLEVPGLTPPLAILATHAEAFSDDGTKRKHLEALAGYMDALDAEGLRVIGGGDLNEIPPTSPVCRDFPEDAGCTDARFDPDTYCGEETWLDPLYRWTPDVTPAAFGADPGPWYTFVGDERFPLNRKLDHLFTNGAWVPGSASALQDALLLSDHVPLVAELELP